MSKLRIIGVLITIFSLSQKSYTQLSIVDSLKIELSRCTNASDSVRTLSELTWNISESNSSESIHYGKLALKAANNISDSVLIADAYDAAALAFRLGDNITQAKEYYKISLDIGARNNMVQRIAWANYNLAKLFIEEGNYPKAMPYIKNSFDYFMRMDNQKMALKNYWQLIGINPEVYSDTLIRVLFDYVRQKPDETNKIFLYLELSNLHNLQKDRKKAMHYVQLAMELAEKHKNTKAIIKAYYQIADYFNYVQHNYVMALTYYEKIQELYQKQYAANQGDVYIELGDMYRMTGKDSAALQYFNKALDSGKKNKHRHTMASAYLKLGDLSYSNLQYSEALNYYLKCWETNCDVCPKIKFHDALINIGNVYLFSGDIRNAEKYYMKSLQIADSASDGRAQSYSWQAFAALYEKQGNLQQAIYYSHKALNKAREAQNLEGQYFNADKLSALYARLNNHQKAFQYLYQSDLLKDSISKTNEIDNLAQLETYFDFQNLQVQRELDKTKSDEEIQRQKIIRNFSIIGFILIGIVGFLIFIGYRRKKRANKLLNEQKLANEKMSQKVHEADQAKLEFYTNVSHEFKTPLTIILGMTEKLKELVSEGNSINLIRKNALKLLQLVNHLLDLRKIDTSKMGLKVKEGDLNDFMKGVISSFDSLSQQKNMDIKFQTNEGLFPAYFDHDKLEKMSSNLLSNAIKYTNNNGTISISLSNSNDGYCKITISDNGIGIADTELINIFDRFYRIPGNNNQGSGIGLALVKELVELHKGEIKVTSKINQGSSFTLVFPVEKQFYSENEFAVNEEEYSNWNYTGIMDIENDITYQKEFAEPNPLKKTLLVIEDNADLRRFIADIFIAEYEIIEAQDGLEGYNKSRDYVPDIIISDLMMPKLNGIQLVDKLKNDVATSHIPIILLTAKNDIATQLDSFEKGVDDFINKPFDSAILKSRVENLLRLRKQLVEKFSKQFQLQPREITIENADQKFLLKAIEIIEKNISNPNLNVELLAFELGVSRTQLYRKLNALTDYPPKNFIRIIRLKRAAQILQQGQNNIAEVMDATGFSNYTYFNNCFKDFFGKYPKNYGIVSVKGNLN
jgi:signal transduction histidine kinase/DNA-binding response OmpR family regulator